MVGLEVLADGGLAPLHVQLAECAGPRFYCEIVLRVLLPAETVTDLLIFIHICFCSDVLPVSGEGGPVLLPEVGMCYL